MEFGLKTHFNKYFEWACNFCIGSKFDVFESIFHRKAHPVLLAAASVVAFGEIWTERIAISPSGTSSFVHWPVFKSHKRIVPFCCPEISSVWLGWRATELTGEPHSNFRLHPEALFNGKYI